MQQGIDKIKSNRLQHLVNLLSGYIQQNSNNGLIGFLGLLSSGFFSAIGFMLIASNRWSLLEPSSTVALILYVQWQTLGLTIVKIGIENVVFAMVSRDETVYFDIKRYLLTRVIPLSAIFSMVVYFVFSPLAALVTFSTLLFDTHSIAKMADLNARRYYLVTSVANLLNYPLFFLMMFGLLSFLDLEVNGVLVLFLISSLARCLWLMKMDIVRTNLEKIFCRVSTEMGMQQILNYLLFRLDQVVLGTAVFSTVFTPPSQDFIQKFIYMAKFPELVSGVIVIAGTILFPKFFIEHPLNLSLIYKQFKRRFAMILCFVISILGLSVVYINFWAGDRINWFFAIPFLIHSICIFPANIITYSMIRAGRLRGLLRNLSISVVVGLVVVFAVYVEKQVMILIWVVAIQLALFISFVPFFPWGKKRELHE